MYLLVLLLGAGGLEELPLDLDLERRDVCGLAGLSFSCFTFTLDSLGGDSLCLCRRSFSIVTARRGSQQRILLDVQYHNTKTK